MSFFCLQSFALCNWTRPQERHGCFLALTVCHSTPAVFYTRCVVRFTHKYNELVERCIPVWDLAVRARRPGLPPVHSCCVRVRSSARASTLFLHRASDTYRIDVFFRPVAKRAVFESCFGLGQDFSGSVLVGSPAGRASAFTERGFIGTSRIAREEVEFARACYAHRVSCFLSLFTHASSVYWLRAQLTGGRLVCRGLPSSVSASAAPCFEQRSQASGFEK